MAANPSAFWPSAAPMVPDDPQLLSFRAVLGFASLFWAYILLTNLVYAGAVRIEILEVAGYANQAMLFLPWEQRLVQHVLMFPVLVACYWTAVRIGWTPARRRLPQQLAIALGFSLLVEWALQASEQLLHAAFGTHADPFGIFTKGDWAVWISSTATGLLSYGFGLALLTGIAASRRYHELRLRNSDLRRKWADARLAALRTQLSPHTLFNVLHMIQARIKGEPEVAESLVASLGDLLRGLLQSGERDFVQLREELQFAELYLGLQTGRFADRLTVHVHNGADVPLLWVPSLILQPLVENAVVHGLADHSGPVRIDVTWRLSPLGLQLEVVNSVGSGSAPGIGGFGLRNVRERLAVQFGGRAILASAPGDAATWVATLHLPLLRDWQP
ncbi:MAG: histidine kinase [Gammaproteobacteria bacterium]|nr:histidine kinase [Gammaproteobacteria bacterium]